MRLTQKKMPKNYRVAIKMGNSLAVADFWMLWKKSCRDVVMDKGFTHAAAIA